MTIETQIEVAILEGPATPKDMAKRLRRAEATVQTIMLRMWGRRKLTIVDVLPPAPGARKGPRLYAAAGTPSRLPDDVAMAPIGYAPPARPLMDERPRPRTKSGSGIIVGPVYRRGMRWGDERLF